MKKLILPALLAAAFAAQPAFAVSPAHKAGHAAQTQQAARAEGVWIDVRSPEEYAEGHLSDSTNIPLEQITGKIAQVQPDKTARSTSTANPAAARGWPSRCWKSWATPM